MEHRAKLTEVTETIELNERLEFTTMAPPKQEEPNQTTQNSRVRTKEQIQSQESKQ
jgi:hypothetical protein